MECQGFENHKKFMYVKQEFLQSIKQNQSKVLINPNFVNPTFVRPHFNKNFLANQTIHVNPKVIRNHEQLKPKEKPLVVSTEKPLVVSTPTKLVRGIKPPDAGARARRTSIHTKYKIIRSTKPVPSPHKNRFAIDRRAPIKKVSPLSVYKKCNVKLKNTNKSEVRRKFLKCGKSKLKILTIRGEKYKLDSSHRTLTLMQTDNQNQKPSFKTIYVGGMTFKQKEPNVFVKTKVKHQLLRQVKQRSINTLTNKMKKSNIPCPLYRKFGKCKGRDTGKCIRLHNPEQISLCPKFLQGACTRSNCLLSHKISAEKMPTCKFFLEGLCSKDDCQYLHVKISSKAEICKDFLEGFCKKGAECDKRHQYLCGDFEKTGKCVKKNCEYPHGDAGEKPKVKSAKDDLDEKVTSSVRYYDETVSSSDSPENADSESEIRKRPRLGSLPAFIPFA